MANLSDLLNPVEPQAPSPDAQSRSQKPVRYDNGGAAPTVAKTTYDAASALTALAHSPPSSFVAYPPPPQSDRYASRRYSDGRPGSSYGVAAPVEPSPPIERVEQPISPTSTLEQYHHGSRSPGEQRRQSFPTRYSPPPRLAPIQTASNSQLNGYQEAYGKDTSKIISLPLASSYLEEDRKPFIDKITQQREPSYTRNELTTQQIRQPSPLTADHQADLQKQISSLSGPTSAPSPTAHIKHEPSATPREITPAQAPEPALDSETLKAVEALKNEHGLRGSYARKQSSPNISIPPSMSESKPPIKKRTAPKSAGATKKGTASTVKKPPAKKRKVEARDGSSPGATPTSGTFPRSMTPSSQRNSKTPAIRGGATSASPAPNHSSPPAASTDAEEPSATDDNEQYCICRRPDNHTWMIACDGGCDDWFHGSCINIQESDGDLIDTYICPNCEAAGKGATTWKPMCRREGCRRPARPPTKKLQEGSKYCSEECGLRFFREKLGMEDNTSSKKKGAAATARRKSNYTDNIESPEMDMGPRGGALRPGEVKALVDAVPDLASFRALGEGVLSPPATVVDADSGGEDPAKKAEAYLNEADRESLARIEKTKEELRAKHALYKERTKFIDACKKRHDRIAKREGVDVKNMCGFDERLAWSDEEFKEWLEQQRDKTQKKRESGEEDMVGGEQTVADADEGPEVCMKKKCSRHQNWKQLVLLDARFEDQYVKDEMIKVDKEEREIRERAIISWREAVNGGDEDARVENVKDGADDITMADVAPTASGVDSEGNQDEASGAKNVDMASTGAGGITA